MSHSKEEILIDYLDNQLEGAARLDAEQLVREDGAAAEELEALQFSVSLIRDAAVLDQVMEARKEFHASAKVVTMHKKESGAVVRSFSRSAFRIAAMVFLLVGVASVYKYSTVTNSSVYENNFTSFDLETSRGANNDGELEKAYRSKDWMAVKNIFSAQQERTARSWFLAGMAELELKNYSGAIASFNEVINVNKNKAEPAFQDEAEYYLAMSCLGANKTAEGVAILKKIRSNKDHLFYKRASAIPALDLKMLEIKD